MKGSSRAALTAIIAVGSLAIVLFGCGGGGGGGGTGVTATSSTSTATTSTATTSTATTSTATTSTATTSTATTSTASTSTATTSTAATAGTLPPDVIFYSQVDTVNFNIRHMNPDGSGDTSFATVPSANFGAVTLNPKVAGQVVFAYQTSSGAPLGIFKNSSVSIVGATQIVAPTYQDVESLQVSSDGKFVYYVANAKSGTGSLFKVSVAGDAPVQLDEADTAHVNIAGTFVVYSKPAANNNRVLWVRGTGSSDTPVAISDDTTDSAFPQFSKDGQMVVFSRTQPDFSYDLFTIASSGLGTVKRLTDTVNTDELGASFNDDASMVSFVVLSFDTSQYGIYRTGTGGVNLGRVMLKFVQNPGDTTYWTSAGGRSPYGVGGLLADRLRRERRRP